MGAMVRCPVRFCQAWVPLNLEEEGRLAGLGDDDSTTEILCIACGVHSDHYRQNLIAAQIESYYSTRSPSVASLASARFG
jgi:hypothetical protein